MKIPLTWLREYCDPELDAKGIEERLTLTGTKVEAIHHHGVEAIENFVIGRVLECERHPDADRLSVCEVDLGPARPEGPATIVCGAANVAAGQLVGVARPGSIMPDGTKLKKAKLRGVPSEGMILAEDELAIGVDHDGIMVLGDLLALPEAELLPGRSLAEVLPIAAEVLELEITPNRPDCLGVYGVARELHAATGAALAPAPWSDDPGSAGPLAGAEVVVECPELCPRFTARIFENVTIAQSPPWLKARLMAAGQRPINNVVDITNYAMLLSGQPLHAFDLDLVAGARLVVRRAEPGEQVQTLDGQTRTLDQQMVVIDDAAGPTSIAGLMGGARSEVSPTTTRVLMEVANWNGPNIHRSSWALGLRSEASSRFEKGLAPEQCIHAQALATQLMIELCGASVLPGTIDIGPAPAPAPVIRLREQRVQRILGVAISVERQAEILQALDFQTVAVADAASAGQAGLDLTIPAGGHVGSDVTPPLAGQAGLDVTVPAVRREDVTREVDLIEEVARIDGVDRLPATLPARRGAAGALNHAQRVRRAAEDALVGRGLHEIVGWSFTDPTLLDRLRIPAEHALRRVLTLENPLSEAQSVMRPTLMGSLLDAAAHNVSRGQSDIAIFESGAVYRAATTGPLADEHHALGALLSGGLVPRSWRGSAPEEADFFAAKALLAAVLDRFRVDWSVTPEQWPFLHPGRSAAVHIGELKLGFVGEVHPLVAKEWDMGRSAVLAIDLGKLAAAAEPVASFKPFASVPPLRQDLAVTLPETVPAAQVLECVRKAGGATLHAVEVFDVYTGPQVGEGRRSLALALTFQAPDRTLTDEDIASPRKKIVAALAELGGELRG
jgi:phenylalanyl-tRNA synthetase beta chain